MAVILWALIAYLLLISGYAGIQLYLERYDARLMAERRARHEDSSGGGSR